MGKSGRSSVTGVVHLSRQFSELEQRIQASVLYLVCDDIVAHIKTDRIETVRLKLKGDRVSWTATCPCKPWPKMEVTS